MAILNTGKTYVNNDQVTAANLNQAVNSSTFASGAVDGSTTQLSGGAIIVRDGGVTPAKLSTGGPSWTSGGSMGIGTANPNVYGTFGRALAISAGSGYANAAIAGSAGSGGQIEMGDASIRHAAIASLTGSDLAIYTNSTNAGTAVTERMRITSDGDVGIGTDAPTEKLEVSGTVKATGFSGPLTGNVTGNASGTAANVTGTVAIANGGTGATTAAGARVGLLPSLATNAGKVLAVNGGATDVEWVSAGGVGTVTSVGVSGADGIGVASSPVTSSGTIALTLGSITPDDVTSTGFVQGSEYRVSGTKVLGAQAAAEVNVSVSSSFIGADTVDEAGLLSAINALENKVNALLAKLRTHGIIAT